MPNQNVDLAAFLGNNPYYASAVPQMTAQTAAPVENYEPSYLTDGQINAMREGNPFIDTPSTRGLDQERFRAAPVQKVDLAAFLGNNPAYNQTPAAAQQQAEDFFLAATPAPSNVTLGPPGMNYGNMGEQYFTQAPMGPMPAYQNPYVGIAGLLNR